MNHTFSYRLGRVPEPGPLVSTLNKWTVLWGHTGFMTRSLKRGHLSCNCDKKTGFVRAGSAANAPSVTSNVTPRANLVFRFPRVDSILTLIKGCTGGVGDSRISTDVITDASIVLCCPRWNGIKSLCQNADWKTVLMPTDWFLTHRMYLSR